MPHTAIRLLSIIAILDALPAVAALLDSPPIVVSNHARCMLANGSDAPAEVTVSFFDSTATQVCQLQGAVPAEGIGSWHCSGLSNRGFCRVEGKFSKGKVKLTICDALFDLPQSDACVAAATTH